MNLNDVKLSDITDPALNALYAKTHGGGSYGTSGIYFLPEALLYFWQTFAGMSDPFKKPITILDYGAGQSGLAEGMRRILTPSLAHMSKDPELTHVGHEGMFARMQEIPRILSISFKAAQKLMTELASGKKWNELEDVNEPNLLTVTRFEPAIPTLAEVPQGPFDYVTCTDVLEHVPDNGVLDNVIRFVSHLGKGVYFNISTRPAEQTLADGQNAHCTVQPSGFWMSKLCNMSSCRYLTPVFSRDLTSVSFTLGITNTRRAPEASYRAIDQFGMIDLIAWPPLPGKKMSLEKAANRYNLQPLKEKICARNLDEWLLHDPAALEVAPLRELAKRYNLLETNEKPKP